MKKEIKKLVILDSHALIHRAFHALPSFVSPAGEPMGAVYGVASVLLKLIKDLKPTHLVAAFDREEPTFRHIAYDKYKATRSATKDDLVPQFEKVRELLGAFHIPIFEVAGFEADDIIATLVQKYKSEKDLSIVIASGDMDTLQLVDGKRIQVYTQRKGIDDIVLYDEEAVQKRYGFGPELIPDYKGLKGDPSDNIIGVKGIGEKTATQLLVHYGSIEEMYKKLKKEKKTPVWLKERIKNLLLENEEEALFSKELATVRRDAPVDPHLDKLRYPEMPFADVSAIFRKFHFPSLLARLGNGNEPLAEGKTKEMSAEDWEKIQKNHTLVFFVEGDDIFLQGDKKEELFEINADFKAKIAKSDFTQKEVVTNDAKGLFCAFGRAFPVAFDARIAAWVCESDQRSFELKKTEQLLEMRRKLEGRLAKAELMPIYRDFELPLTPILFRMEQRGILLDKKALKEMEIRASGELEALSKEIHQLAGEAFDINSPKQLSRILFEKLNLSTKGIRKTAGKSVSTQFSELVKLKSAHPIVEKIIKYRELAKLLSTYITVLPDLAAMDGRIHTTFNQTGASTGRLSSQNPNLQNIPIKTELGREVRRSFVAENGFELVSFDYSQLELRIAADFAREEKLISAFSHGEDIHARTASEVFDVDAKDVTKEMRRKAKTINFGILYGMGARALAEGMGVSTAEAETYLEKYLEDFPGIAAYRTKTIEEGRKNGYVTTLFGRKRYLPNLRSSFDYVRKEAERMAVNAPIQGTEADLIKRAMIEIEGDLGEDADVRMLLQVHDELLFEIAKDKVKNIVPRIRAIMERVPELQVPIVVDAKYGPNWQDMKPLE